MIPVLYEDNHLLVVEKPVNMPVQKDASNDEDLLTALKEYIKEKYQKPGDVYLGLVHRLDRPVGGVMVFARTSKAAKRLSEQFASHRAKKQYVAVVDGCGSYYQKLVDYLVKDESTNTVSCVSPDTPGAKQAVLSYRMVAHKEGRSLLDVSLFTGRPHQIRVQLSHAKLPIYGDARYNPGSKPGQQIALWAYSLAIEHPTTKEMLQFVSLPKQGIWKEYQGSLNALSKEPRMLYKTEDFLAYCKPQGMTTAAEDGGEENLESVLNQSYGEVYPVHRLDANTGGIVLFARTKKAQEGLLWGFKNGYIKKTYHALLCGVPQKKKDQLEAYLIKDAQNGRVTVVEDERNHAKKIVTRYQILASHEDISLAKIEILTGRTHQIRAHMAYIGFSVLGDERYGNWKMNKKYQLDRQALWAVNVEFCFPKDSEWAKLNGIKLTTDAPFAICSYFGRET